MKLLTWLVVVTLSTAFFVAPVEKLQAIFENVVIYQIQTAGSGAGTATQELVLLYNASDNDINVTNWCIEYRTASYNLGFEQCIEPPKSDVELWLKANSILSFATEEFVVANPGFTPDFLMAGGINSSSGHIVLLDNLTKEIDKVGWGGATNPEGLAASVHISGEALSRDLTSLNIDTDLNIVDFRSSTLETLIESSLYEIEVEVDLCLNLDGVQSEVPEGYLLDSNGNCIEDYCPNLEGLQLVAPIGYIKPDNQITCEEIPLEDRVIFITELLPNPPSYDTDAEFIELYNPHGEIINLAGYKIQVGPSYTKEFVFTDGVILPGEYLVFNDGFTGITLPNSKGVQLRLIAPAGNLVSQTEIYSNAGDDVSWALVDDQWIFTNQITPDKPNKPYLEPVVTEVEGTTTVYAPCPAGKFRNPETNRCRNIETAISQLVPCDEDEYRNPDTNRCRKISNTNNALKPCDEGEERNPETNRCRKISTLSANSVKDIPTVSDAPFEQTSGSINWGIIAISVGSTAGYMIYEWRSELSRALVRIKITD